MTDRERRLCRALIRLATAHDLIERAATIERLGRKVKWMAGEVRRELEKVEAKP